MAISKTGFRLYIRYKAHSSDLFKTIRGRDLSTISKWEPQDRKEYAEWLNAGYIRNRVCFGARRRFRDEHVKLEDRDEEHETAIRNAEANCATYEELHSQFQQALSAAERSADGEETENDESENDESRNDEGKKSGGKHPRLLKESDNDILHREWKQNMEIKAQMETEAERAALCLYSHAEKHLMALKVADHEVPLVMNNVLRNLAPNTSVSWRWSDRAVIQILARVGDIPDSKMQSIVISAAVAHRKSVQMFVRTHKRLSFPQRASRHIQDIQNMTVLLYILHDISPELFNGRFMWSATEITILQAAVKEYKLKGSFPPIAFRRAVPKDLFAKDDTKRILAECVVSQRSQRSLRSEGGEKSTVNLYTNTLRAFKALCKRRIQPGNYENKFINLILNALAQALDGELDISLAILHPAKFLYQLKSLPSGSGVHTARERIRNESALVLISELSLVVRTAAQLFDLQYYDYYEEMARTGDVPKECSLRNPFEDDKNNTIFMAAEYERMMPMSAAAQNARVIPICIDAATLKS